jgi:hypothetical protein
VSKYHGTRGCDRMDCSWLCFFGMASLFALSLSVSFNASLALFNEISGSPTFLYSYINSWDFISIPFHEIVTAMHDFEISASM